MSRKNLSKYASRLIQKEYSRERGNHYIPYEYLSHDGYDCEGPKSDIYDLFIFDRKKKIVRYYQCENWYVRDVEYQLEGEYTLSEFKEKFGKNSYWSDKLKELLSIRL